MTEQELNQHRADLNQLDIEQLRCGVMMQLHTIESLTAERDALKDAARLALTALNRAVPQNERQVSEQTEAIAALKAVLK